MTASVLATAIPRDRWGRPLVIPPDGGKPVGYTRCTTFVKALEDTYNLERWKMRMTAIGLASRQDLNLAVVAHREDKERLNSIVEQAVEAAQASAAATTGTALHSLTEQLDRGTLDLASVPAAYQGDLIAYQDATAALRHLDIERFLVNDEFKIGGTPDRRVLMAGTHYIFDIKTGSIEYSMGTIAMQLAVYSRSLGYDIDTGERTPVEVDQNRGIVCHLPAGQGRCDLYWVDIDAGWKCVPLAARVRAWRDRKGLHRRIESTDVGDLIMDQIAATTEHYDLRLLWARNQATGWTDAHTAAAAIRKREILDTQGVTA